VNHVCLDHMIVLKIVPSGFSACHAKLARRLYQAQLGLDEGRLLAGSKHLPVIDIRKVLVGYGFRPHHGLCACFTSQAVCLGVTAAPATARRVASEAVSARKLIIMLTVGSLVDFILLVCLFLLHRI
jgi:hypothetical protein